MNGRPQPVRVTPGDRLYPSYMAALQALGISISGTTYRRVRDGYPIGGYYIDPIEPDDPDWFRVPSRSTRPEHRKLGRPVRCVETGELFPSASEAARTIHVHRNGIFNSIYRGCRAGGFHWAYAEEAAA
jgi:hypothetical protein